MSEEQVLEDEVYTDEDFIVLNELGDEIYACEIVCEVCEGRGHPKKSNRTRCKACKGAGSETTQVGDSVLANYEYILSFFGRHLKRYKKDPEGVRIGEVNGELAEVQCDACKGRGKVGSKKCAKCTGKSFLPTPSGEVLLMQEVESGYVLGFFARHLERYKQAQGMNRG